MPLESSPSTVGRLWPVMPVPPKSESHRADDGASDHRAIRRALVIGIPVAGLALAVGYALLAG